MAAAHSAPRIVIYIYVYTFIIYMLRGRVMITNAERYDLSFVGDGCADAIEMWRFIFILW